MEKISTPNNTYTGQLEQIIEKERKRRRKKTTGIILSSVGAITSAYGLIILSQESDRKSKAIKETAGGILLGAGIMAGGISIPIFTSAKKKRKERDLLIKEVRY